MPYVARWALIAACAAMPLAATAHASAHPTKQATLPSVEAARTIVSGLWTQREWALTRLDAASISPLEIGSARQQDVAYINGVRCRCEPMKGDHPVTEVVPQVPQTSLQPVFFAQVRTTAVQTGTHPWYVVAVEREGGKWKFAFIVLGGNQSAPPLQKYTHSSGATPGMTSAVNTRIAQLVQNTLQYVTTHNELQFGTDYGASVQRSPELHASIDGVFGLALPSGDVLACYTLHTVDTYTMPGSVLQQGPTQSQWGHQLAPGNYASVTFDSAAPTCVSGTGIGDKAGYLRFNYDNRVVGTKGVPA